MTSSIEDLRLLQRAARKGRHDLVASLIMNGAAINAADDAGRTAAHEAARNGHVQVLNVLHMLGADLSARSDRGVSVAHQAAYGGHVAFLQRLVAIGARVDWTDHNDCTPLEVAIEAHQYAAAEYLETIYSEHVVEEEAYDADDGAIDTELQAPSVFPLPPDLFSLLNAAPVDATDHTDGDDDATLSSEELDLPGDGLQSLLPSDYFASTKKRPRETTSLLPPKRLREDRFLSPSTPVDQAVSTFLRPPVSSPPSLLHKQLAGVPWRRKPEVWRQPDDDSDDSIPSRTTAASVAELMPETDHSIHSLLATFEADAH
ncbi:hypothetical protein SDRG_17044 [Saprolegnia diclina VS20]|uniref:Uncharacterized protein n=1 Tax=Saprolegnia diclina (strain VS20) TaxID=1156394 RepID=T0QZ89_SAPDV|nr:hypothetical protein SDRG_17044 [Saprolegnia diclina VS20]EQC25068.1 hypothetical protein SDRG_17044 [Saprolegnia diclina VS20]|eukprot:XP_008621498.1 hypothetical protein SDRG_17044 [Saprolegnia diclina VS20]